MTKSYNVENADQEKVRGIFLCRVQLAILGFCGCIPLYMQRVNMSLAIVCMTIDPEVNDTTAGNFSFGKYSGYTDEEECPNEVHGDDGETGEFDWDRQLRGLINGAFYIGYFITQVPGGWMATKFSRKWVLGIGMIISTVCSFLSPPGARLSPYCLMAVRIIQGLGQGVYFPVFHQFWISWAPPMEKTKLITFVVAGVNVGTIFSYLFSGMICEDLGWPWVFHIYGFVGAVWIVIWFIMAFDTPDDHPWIKDVERRYISESIGEVKQQPIENTPWRQIFTSVPVWAVTITYFCSNWGDYTSLTSYGQYMEDVLKFDIKSNGFYNALPHICKFISTLAVAQLVDFARRKEVASTTVIRKITQTFGSIPPAIFLIILGYMDCFDWEWAIVMLCLSETFTACTRSGAFTNMAEVGPRYAGVVMGIANSAGTIPGVVAPIVVGQVVTTGAQEEWQIIFYISAGIYVVCALTFGIFASSVPQPWGTLVDEETLELGEAKNKTDEKEGYSNEAVYEEIQTARGEEEETNVEKSDGNISTFQASNGVYTPLENY